MNFTLFAIVFLLVMGLANFYVYRRFLRVLTPSLGQLAWGIPAFIMVGEIFFVLDNAFNLLPESPIIYYISSTLIGCTFMLFVITTFYDLVITVSRRVPFDSERRKTLKIFFDITMLIAAFTYLFRGLSQGLKDPLLNRVEVRVKDFPFDGFSVLQLTDVHVGRTIKREFIEALVDRTNALNPDIVVLTGDLVDLPLERIRYDLEPLRGIKAPTFFIPGNHEYFHGPQEVIEYIRSIGIQALLNSSVRISRGEKKFNLIGLTDLVGERMGVMPPDPEKAYTEVDSNLPCIVLAHQPKMINRMRGYRCDLMLSGHTHGGQIFPFGFLVMFDQPYLAGLHQHEPDQQIFISRGTGYWGPPLRVLAPSEISQIVIRPA